MTAGLRLAIWSTLGIAFARPVQAQQDYRPVVCITRAAYEGAALRAPVVAALPGSIPDAGLDQATAAALDRSFDAMHAAARAPALGIAVGRVGEGLWSRTQAPADQPRLWWASVGKLFVATVVLQLVEEGVLSLDEPVARWTRQEDGGVPNDGVATVRDLLAHTSGLFSANEDRRLAASPRYIPPGEMRALLRRHGAMFCPGARWRYSNSGYDLLAAMVQEADGRPLAEAIEARIVRPLGATSIMVLRPGQPSPDVAPPVTARKDRPVTQPAHAGAGGPIAASPADMVRFLAALLGGQLLKPETVDTMFATLHPMFDANTYYGLGVMVLDVADDGRQDSWLGHAGGAPGVSAMLAYSPADQAIVAVALTGDAPAAAVANGVLKTLRSNPR